MNGDEFCIFFLALRNVTANGAKLNVIERRVIFNLIPDFSDRIGRGLYTAFAMNDDRRRALGRKGAHSM